MSSLEESIGRVYKTQLQIFFALCSSLCEVCLKPLPSHEWADIDINGFVINCSNEEFPALSEVTDSDAVAFPLESSVRVEAECSFCNERITRSYKIDDDKFWEWFHVNNGKTECE